MRGTAAGGVLLLATLVTLSLVAPIHSSLVEGAGDLSDPDYGQPLQNVKSQYYLDVAGDSGVRNRRGANVNAWTRIEDRDSQNWVLDDKTNYIKTGSDKCLTVSAGSKGRRGANVVSATCNGANTQKWERSQGGIIKNKGNSMCLDIASNLDGRVGTNVFVWNCDGSNRQQWTCKRSCLHGGTIDENWCKCTCVPHWEGHTCEKCGINCENGGHKQDDCTCKCDSPWAGKHCTECTRQCVNGGVLDEKTCTCTCSNPWIGITCEKCNRVCENNSTLDERTCTCACAKYWKGDTCNEAKWETEEVDGRDNSDAVTLLVRYIDAERNKCQPEPLPPLTNYQKVRLTVHRDLKNSLHSYKMKLMVSATEVESFFDNSVGNIIQVNELSPEPCQIAADPGEFVQQSMSDIAGSDVPAAIDFIIKDMNAKRRACELPELGQYQILSVESKVVDGIMLYIELMFAGEKKAQVVLWDHVDGRRTLDSVNPSACKIGQELTQVLESMDPTATVRMLELDNEADEAPTAKLVIPNRAVALLQTQSKNSGFDETPIPEIFDARSYYNECFQAWEIQDQGKCGASYAFATTSALSHRLCVKSHGIKRPVLSARQQIDCNRNFRVGSMLLQMGCDGGSVIDAIKYYGTTGAVTEECFPFYAQDYDHSGAVHINPDGVTEGPPTTCPTARLSSCMQYFVAESTINVAARHDIDAMKRGIMDGGAVISSVHVDEAGAFMKLKDEVYSADFGQGNAHSFGEQSVVLVGWGQEDNNGTEYWIVENSWGYHWGMQGYGKVAIGTNVGGIEEKAMWADIAVNKRCSMHCYNGGMRDPATCNCRCMPGWVGEDCRTPSKCACSQCGEGYECGGQGDCPTAMNWCKITDSTGKLLEMAVLQEDSYLGPRDLTEEEDAAAAVLRGSNKYVKHCKAKYSMCLLK